ncbi:hypothetical protein O7621_27605 [Solwaraspora sp. WMMD937]|uniref:hypothetical protein n=1 Tax=Solwaraspora sp. WMMD937 TaxID=3016090 RepID=UPI00249AA6DD|nr:hypothetical protein [Solwaraspora sp. WMMD937]WFE21550.1 hypothetical protein O7621_27605 [Solwaraspora sp. WMMD937]
MGDGSRGLAIVRAVAWWTVLRLVIVLLWLVAAATAWWTAPRQHDYDQARADVAAGRVVAYQWGDGWDRSRRGWFDVAELRSSGQLGPLFGWRTADGRVRWTNTATFGAVTAAAADGGGSYAGPGAAALARDLRAAGLEERVGGVQSVVRVGTQIGFVLLVTFLVVLVGGPAPALGTRWYWFWLVYLTPLGLGLLWWLGLERPWSGKAAALPGVVGVDQRRYTGLLGFAFGLLAALGISLLTMVLHIVLGGWWVPQPGG